MANFMRHPPVPSSKFPVPSSHPNESEPKPVGKLTVFLMSMMGNNWSAAGQAKPKKKKKETPIANTLFARIKYDHYADEANCAELSL